jgi:UDP-glucuronate 4-epimerase
MKILVTGAAGFIGFHLAKRFLERGDEVIGIDNLNDYYDVSLKESRLGQLQPYKNFTFYKIDISDRGMMEKLFRDHEFDRVVHMAAQAGVRYSLKNPHVYVQSNIVGFMNILEGCRHQWKERLASNVNKASNTSNVAGVGSVAGVAGGKDSPHLVFASSSSVYGLNSKLPFSTGDNVDHPISLYAATKKSTELMAHTYSHLYGMPTTGLRFFTVYGPWGRPDMALFKFTKAILNGEKIDVYNEGNMRRDFTYIDDIVEGVVRVSDRIPKPLESRVTNHESRVLDPGTSPTAPYRIYNIGNHSPVKLMDFIGALEKGLGKEAKKNFLPMQPGDVKATYADVDDLMRDVGFSPSTPVEDGIRRFVEWYNTFYSSKVKAQS